MTRLDVAAEQWRATARELKDEGWWLGDLCGLDRAGLGGEPRFEAVVQLLRHARKERLTVHVAAEGDPPTVPSITDLWPAADFMEREAFDLVGIVFDGHPNLRRIMMPDEWEGHPLRKDYAVGKRAIQFLDQPFLQIDSTGQSPRSREAGVSVGELGEIEGESQRR